MALMKIDNKNRKLIIKVITRTLILANMLLSFDNIQLRNKIEERNSKVDSLQTKIEDIQIINKQLNEELSIKINSESDIRVIREDIIDSVKEIVTSRNREIQDIDILRALNSTENRIMDEYLRVTSLVLATMETESNFKYIENTNSNNTTDHGIMQVNDVAIPHIKEALGEHMDPANNKDHNVEGGSWEIHECYLKAKDKHPEDVIWWTYAYYNRGMYFENTDAWKNPSNPNYKAVHNQANVRSKIFKEAYNAYYNGLTGQGGE